MNRLLPCHYLKKNLTHQTAVTAAVAGSAALFFMLDRDDDELQHLQSIRHPWLAKSVDRVSCEGLLLPPTPGGASAASFARPRGCLKRAKTVDVVKQTACRNSLESKYRVDWVHKLGEGAFGSVHRAIDLQNKEVVAVKRISKQFTDTAAFEREMDALLLLSSQAGGHPNVCSLREHFDEGDHFYLVLDLVEGGEMFDHLVDRGAYSEADAARLFCQVTSALALLHGIGIVHSDLKPENLMLSTPRTEDAAIKIVDFGCAHVVTSDPNDQSNRGNPTTPSYCPPEVLQVYREENAEILPSFDMWSLGVILYVMLTGVHPFDPQCNRTDEEIEEAILSGYVPLRNSTYTAHLSEGALAVMEGLMNREPEERWAADRLLEHPWVRGKTASTKKMELSDKRLAAYRRHKTRVGSSFFLSMLQHSDAHGGSRAAQRATCLESAFRELGNGQALLDDDSTELGDATTSNDTDMNLSFSEMSDLLSENMNDQYFQKGQTIYSEGEKGDSMYFINSGTIQVTSNEGFKKQRKAGEFFGEDALMNSTNTRTSSVQCSTHVHAIEISRGCFEKYMQANPLVEITMAETNRVRHRERSKTILGLQKNIKSLEFGKNDVIFQKGSPGDMLYILEEGSVEISVDGQVVRCLKQGEMTGEHAAFHDKKPYNVTAQCVTNKCRLGALQSKDMRELFQSNPSLRDSFHDIILRRDFKKALCFATQKPFPETVEDLRAAFDAIDVDKSGEIEAEDLRRIMLLFDPSYSEGDINIMLESLDLNKSESLTWAEFKSIFGMANEA